jgi:hypothetical protein
MWLSFIDEIIINEVLKTHEGYDGRYDTFEGYSEDKLSVALIVPSPYDRLYTAYLKMKIDQENGETARYNNSAALYNTYMSEYRKHYNKTHMPLNTLAKRNNNKPMHKANVGLSDAEYENLKKDMTFILTEHFSDAVSPDKLSAIVTDFVQNNIDMLKGKDGLNGLDGKDGYTPIKGKDYFDGTQGIQGKQGIQGEPGYTPKRGTDYWTPEDVNAMADDVAENVSPKIYDGEWWVYDSSKKSLIPSGIKAEGVDGYTPQKGIDYFDGKQGIQGIQGIPGHTPNIVFRYDEATGIIYYSSDTMDAGEEYVLIRNVAAREYVSNLLLEYSNKVAPSPASVTLYADRWEQNEEGTMWYQEVVVANATITEYSKIDLQLSAEQITIFYEKDLAFVAENDGGVVTVYCIGQVPENDYVLQATVSEVLVNG